MSSRYDRSGGQPVVDLYELKVRSDGQPSVDRYELKVRSGGQPSADLYDLKVRSGCWVPESSNCIRSRFAKFCANLPKCTGYL